MSKHGKAAVWFSLYVGLSGYTIDTNIKVWFVLAGIGLLLHYALLVYSALLLIELFSNSMAKKYTLMPLLLIVFSLYNYWNLPVRSIAHRFGPKPLYNGFCEHTANGGVLLVLRKDSTFTNSIIWLGSEDYEGTYLVKGDTVILKYNNEHPDDFHDTLVSAVGHYGKALKEFTSDTFTKKHNHFYSPRINKLF